MFTLAFHLQNDEFGALVFLVFFAVVVLCAFIYERGRKQQREEHEAKRAEVMNSLCNVIYTHDVTLFGVVVERSSYSDPLIQGFEELCNRFELFLNHLHNEGNQQRGLIIFDSSRHESTLQKLLLEYRNSGTRFGKLKHMSDVPLFTDSKATRNLQLADLVAHALFRRYERSDTRWLDQIITKFDTASDGSIHGLVHMATNRHNCQCHACLTRRMART